MSSSSLTTVNTTDIQFDGNTVNQQKLRRLVHDLQQVESALNLLVQQVQSLTTTVETPAGTEVLATTTGLGPSLTVSGLTASMVLTAVSATQAAFRKLALTDLADVLLTNPTNGDLLTFVDGEFVNLPLSVTPTMTNALNLGTGLPLYAGVSSGKLAFRSVVQGSGITLSEDSMTLTISANITSTNVAQTDAMSFFLGGC
jgi:hypothetical protein